MSERNKSNARAYVEASSAHDLEAIRSLLDADLVYESPNVGRFEGRDEALSMMAGFFERYPDVAWAVDTYRSSGADAVEFDFVLTATDSESGEALHRRGLERIEFAPDGGIVRIVVGSPRAGD